MKRSEVVWVSMISVCVLAFFVARAYQRDRAELVAKTAGTQREASSREAMALLNEWSPTLAMPRLDDILAWQAGKITRGEIRPMEKPSGPTIIGAFAEMTFSYESGPVEVGMKQTGDGSEPFIDRAVSGYRYLAALVPPTDRK